MPAGVVGASREIGRLFRGCGVTNQNDNAALLQRFECRILVRTAIVIRIDGGIERAARVCEDVRGDGVPGGIFESERTA